MVAPHAPALKIEGKGIAPPPSFLQRNPQLPQLALAHRRWRIAHKIDRAGRLGERNYFAQALCSGENHDNAIQSQRDASMRRRAVLQCFQEKTEAGLGFFIAHAERLENFSLNVLTVNTNRSRAQLGTIEHDVVG